MKVLRKICRYIAIFFFWLAHEPYSLPIAQVGIVTNRREHDRNDIVCVDFEQRKRVPADIPAPPYWTMLMLLFSPELSSRLMNMCIMSGIQRATIREALTDAICHALDFWERSLKLAKKGARIGFTKDGKTWQEIPVNPPARSQP